MIVVDERRAKRRNEDKRNALSTVIDSDEDM